MTTTTIILLAVFLAVFVLVAFFDVRRAKKEKKRYHKKECIAAYLMLLPAVILAFLFVMLPILYSLGYAFTDFYLLTPDKISFIGFDNFKAIFEEIGQHGDMYYAIKNTLIFVVLVVPLQIGLALGLALFCNRKVPFVGVFKVCFSHRWSFP